MNLTGYLIGIAIWMFIGYLLPTHTGKLLCLIPILYLAVRATMDLFKKGQT